MFQQRNVTSAVTVSYLSGDNSEFASVVIVFNTAVEIVPVVSVCAAPVAEAAPAAHKLAEQEIFFAVAVVIADCGNFPVAVVKGADPTLVFGVSILPGEHVACGLLPDDDIINIIALEVADRCDFPIAVDCGNGFSAPCLLAVDIAVVVPQLVNVGVKVFDNQTVSAVSGSETSGSDKLDL